MLEVIAVGLVRWLQKPSDDKEGRYGKLDSVGARAARLCGGIHFAGSWLTTDPDRLGYSVAMRFPLCLARRWEIVTGVRYRTDNDKQAADTRSRHPGTACRSSGLDLPVVLVDAAVGVRKTKPHTTGIRRRCSNLTEQS